MSKRKSNPNGANQYVLDPRQELFFSNYFDPKSDTFSNGLQSALKAGFSEEYAKVLMSKMPTWLSEKVNEMSMLSKAERNINKVLDLETKNKEGDEEPQLLKIQSDVSKFIAERLGRKKYGEEPAPINNLINFFLVDDQLKRVARRIQDGDTTSETPLDRLPDSNQPQVRT